MTAATRSRLARYVAPVIGVLTFFAVWELFVRVFGIPAYKLPQPSDVLSEMVRSRSTFLHNAIPSLTVMIEGILLALAVSAAMAAWLAQSSFAERAVMPIAVFVQVTPLYAYANAIVLWVGFGLRSLVVMIAIVCFPPFLMNLTQGLRDVDADALELLRSADASRWEIFRHLRVPSALPQFFSALKIASGLALVGVTIGEQFAVVSEGLGYVLKKASAAGLYGTSQLWATIFVLGLIGSLAYIAISGVERFVLRWHTRATGAPREPAAAPHTQRRS